MVERFVPAVIADLQNIKKTIGGLELERAFLRSNVDSLNVRQGPMRIKTGDFTDIFVWNVGKWNEKKWGAFDPSTLSLIQVDNPNREFVEPFYTNDFDDTGVTTATWTGGTLSLTTGEIAQSLPIAFDGVTIFNKGKITIIVDDLSLITLSLSFDGGSTFQTVTDGILTDGNTTTTDGVVWKVSSSGTAVIDQLLLQYDT